MPDITPEQLKEMNQALVTLRETVEKKDAESGESKEKIAKLEEKLDSLEELNQKVTAERAQEAKNALELKERADELEKKLARLPAAGKGREELSAEMKAFEMLAKKGMSGLKADEQKYLRTDSDTEGGYLAPVEYVTEIIKKITEVSPIRQYARVRKTNRGEIELPQRTSLLQGGFRGEGGSLTVGQSAYGMTKIPAHFLDVIVVATTSMLTDAAFNMETEINSDVVESFAQIEGNKFVLGTLPTEPEGIATSALITNVTQSAQSADISADDFLTTQGNLKRGYNPMWMLNRRTLARVRKMKDGMGQYLFTQMQAGQPASIAGEPYALAIDVPDIASNAKCVLYGDFLRGYTIVDAITMTMLRDPYTYADTGKVRFVFSKRTGGKVVLAEALSTIQCGA
jgi:HK97 family phage major capsid protein